MHNRLPPNGAFRTYFFQGKVGTSIRQLFGWIVYALSVQPAGKEEKTLINTISIAKLIRKTSMFGSWV
jgi:hypothetical protein